MYKQLTEPQRYEIYLGLKRKWSKSRIACEIGVSASTVSREVRRNADPSGEYVWTRAQSRCVRRRHGLPGGRGKDSLLWWRVERMIVDEGWSPAQAAGVPHKHP